jgi:uncharacterized protein (DUF305 family)
VLPVPALFILLCCKDEQFKETQCPSEKGRDKISAKKRGSANMQKAKMEKRNYQKFALMIVISFLIMYGVMFTNVAQLDHIMLSNTRTYMTLLMIAPMALLKLIFMGSMYKNKKLNAFIATTAILTIIVAFTMLRNQTLIKDVQYMKAMIPHHSSAIMVSQNATFEDPETEKLAQDIIEAQKREIEQMEEIIARFQKKP